MTIRVGLLAKIGDRLRAFGGLDWRRRLLLAEALVWLAAARLVLIVFPFRVVAARLGDVSPPSSAAEPILDEDTRLVAREIGWAVIRMADHVPFRAVCLQQAVAAKMMLRRRRVPSVLHFGVMRQSQPFMAHAWLESSGVKITGYPLGDDVVEVARFV